MNRLSFTLAVLAIGSFVSGLRAAPPFFPDNLPADHPPFCRVNAAATQERITAFKASPYFSAPISATTHTIIVVRVDFSDQVMTQTQAQANTFMSSVKNFYLENSYGLLSPSATVTNNGSGVALAFRMPRALDYYANGLSSRYAELARDAVAVATTASINFTPYNHIMILHAGNGSETGSGSQISSNIWSAYAPSSFLGGPTIGAKVFPGATFVPESEFLSVDPLGVIVHEYGHQLGLPDLYNAETGATKVGAWSLMDSGVYLPNPASGGFAIGANPAHFDAWSKQFLGFSSTETISFTLGTTKTLTQAQTSRTSFIRLPISVGGSNEYFLLEYRRSGTSNGVNYDKFLPGQAGGLLIWHVDDSIALNTTRLDNNNVNNGSPNLGVDLVEAGTTDTASTGGSSADPWPGASVTFQTTKARAFNGKESGIVVSDISNPGSASISVTLKSIISGVSSSDSVAVGGGPSGYTNPSKGELVRITLKPTSAGVINLKIYSLSGDLVHESSLAATAGAQPTETWNGNNKDGKGVSSGIYVLHVEGGGLNAKKKIAIIK
ncbi:MAG: hypothetical protein A2901_02600 [Elusimicrobia bacterium RIFCSPLOWO2_01_FULL_54_10]|nr:MAG: hypothetical protein A2901_02600 [Elusimicrobia bacterium RIFCSPLOWO2_01_FULL_54_10]